MKIITIILIAATSMNIMHAQNKLSEDDYSIFIQSLIGGEREVSVKNGRVDLVTDEFAIEIEKAPKWKEAIGQCLWYALNTNKKPAIILLIEDKSHYKYLIQLETTLNYGNLNESIKVFAFPQDFETLIEKKKIDSK